MAVIDCKFSPGIMRVAVTVKIVLPESGLKESKKLPVFWMLHGGGNNSIDVLYGMNIVDIAEKYKIAFVIPDAQNSCFRDMVNGPKWMTYITETLPAYVYKNYPISEKREDNVVCGFSMGGYGALQLSLLKPQRYAYSIPMSIGNEAVNKYKNNTLDPDFNNVLRAVFGDEKEDLSNTDADCYYIIHNKTDDMCKVKYLLCAGERDFTYNDTENIFHEMVKAGFDCEFIANPFAHEACSWQDFIERAAKWYTNEIYKLVSHNS